MGVSGGDPLAAKIFEWINAYLTRKGLILKC